VLTDDRLKERLGAQARKTALEEWDYSLQAKRLLEFYERIKALGRRAG